MSPPTVSSPEVEKDAAFANETPSGGSVVDDRPLFGGASTIPMWKFYIMCFGLTLMTGINASAIQAMNVAVGFIAKDLNFQPQEVQWIVSAYTLSSGCLLLLFIPLCTKFGHREVFNFATIVYTAGAVGCAAAKTPIAFIACRALMGIGASSGIPAGFGVLANTLPIIEGSAFRGLAIGVYAAGAPLGSAMGTLFGGLPTGLSAITWRGIFVVLACLGTTCFLCTVWTMPPNKREAVPGGPDYLGTAIITLGLTLVLLCLSQGPADGWTTPYIVALLLIGCLMFPIFVFYEVWVERRGWTPMLRMSNFRRGRFGLINFLGLFGFMSFAVWDYHAGLYFVEVHNLGPIQVMLRYLPQTIGGFVGGISANYLLRKISTQYVFCMGCLFAALGATNFAVSDGHKSYWATGQFFAFFLSINGACFVYASSILYSVSVVVPSEMGAAGGLYQVMTSLAPAMGNVLSTIVYTNQLVKAPTDPDNMIKAFSHAFWFAAGAGYFALIVAIPGLWGIGVLGRSGESARIEELVVQHKENEIFAIKEKEKDAEIAASTMAVNPA